MGKYNVSYNRGRGMGDISHITGSPNVLDLNGPSWMQPAPGVIPDVWGGSKINIDDPCIYLGPGTGAYLACKNSTAGGTSTEEKLQAQADAKHATSVRQRHAGGEYLNSSAYEKYVAPYTKSSIWD